MVDPMPAADDREALAREIEGAAKEVEELPEYVSLTRGCNGQAAHLRTIAARVRALPPAAPACEKAAAYDALVKLAESLPSFKVTHNKALQQTRIWDESTMRHWTGASLAEAVRRAGEAP